jgi:hypothetical protein
MRETAVISDDLDRAEEVILETLPEQDAFPRSQLIYRLRRAGFSDDVIRGAVLDLAYRRVISILPGSRLQKLEGGRAARAS